MKYALILAAIMTSACAKSSEFYIDPAFQPQWEAFKLAARGMGRDANQVDNLKIEFGDTEAICGPEAVGCCRKGDYTPTILIHQKAWEELNASNKEILIFHELGHCLLGRTHNDKKQRHIPVSIMNSTSTGTYMTSFYEDEGYRRDYIIELFGWGEGPDFEKSYLR